MPLTGSAPVTVLEGDYSDWTIYDSFDDTDVANTTWYNEAIINKDETEALLIDTNAFLVKRYTIATKALSTIVSSINYGRDSYNQLATVRSIQQTYVVFISNDTLSIVKNGVVIKTLTNVELGFGANIIRSASISRSGKYVVVSGGRDASGNMGWVVLVGS